MPTTTRHRCPQTMPEWRSLILDVVPQIVGSGRFSDRKVWIYAVISHAVAALPEVDREDAWVALPTVLLRLQAKGWVQLHRADLARRDYGNNLMYDRSKVVHLVGPTFYFLEIS